MTELNDHLKLLFARAAQLLLPRLRRAGAARHARRRSSTHCARGPQARATRGWSITFPVDGAEELQREARCCSCWSAQGYTRIHARRKARARSGAGPAAHRHGRAARASSRRWKRRCGSARAGQRVRARDDDAADRSPHRWRFSSDLHCADCDIHYPEPTPSAVLVQLAARRLRDLPRLRPRDRHRLRAGRPRRIEDPARRRGQAVADAELQGMPGRPRASTRRSAASRWTSPCRELHAGSTALGPRRRAGVGELAQVLARHLVRRARASSSGWRPRPTRCTSACCCRKYRAYTPCTACDGARLKPERCCGARHERDADRVLRRSSASAARLKWTPAGALPGSSTT